MMDKASFDQAVEVLSEYLDEMDRENLRDLMSNYELAEAMTTRLIDRGLRIEGM